MAIGKPVAPFFFVLLTVAVSRAAGPIDIGSRLEPLVDDYLIETRNGVTLVLHQPVSRELALVHDKPWEGNVSCYHAVFRDGDLYRMYYRGWGCDLKTGKGTHQASVCYAESKDGIHWVKPNLGLFAFNGSKENNIVWQGIGAGDFAPFLDTNPKCPPDQRYKALGLGPGKLLEDHFEDGGLQAFQSPDGSHWRLIQAEPVITKGAFDSQNLAFWDLTRQCYVEFHRGFRDKSRDIMTSTSTDFVHWTEPVWLEYPGAEKEQLYTNAVTPYARAPHILLGFPMRYVGSRSSRKVEGAPKDAGAFDAVTDGLFMTSRDGRQFHRWPEAFVRPGLQGERWITRNNMTAWGIVQTKSELSGASEELSIYSTEGYYQGASSRLRRFTLRLDGFVSVHASSRGGEMTTRPLTFAGKFLKINYSTSAAGSIRVEIQNEAGKSIPGFSLEDCPEIYGDRIEQAVAWKHGGDVSRLAGQSIRLRFVLKDADLYAIRFQ